MNKAMSFLYGILSVLTLLDIVVEYFLPSLALFHATVFQVRMATYSISQYATGLLLLLALFGRTGRRLVGFSALLFLLVLIQAVLTGLGAPVMLHALDGIAILAASAYCSYLGIARIRHRA